MTPTDQPAPPPSAFALLTELVRAWDRGDFPGVSALVDVARVHTGLTVTPGSSLEPLTRRFAGTGR